MATLPVARLLASRLLAAAAQEHTSSAAAAAAWRAYASELTQSPASSSAGSATSTSAAAQPAAAQPAAASNSSSPLRELMPTWLTSWLPSNTKSKRSRPVTSNAAGTSASSSSSGGDSDKQQEEQRAQQKKDDKNDPWKDIEKHRDCSLDVFQTRCQNAAADLDPPSKKPGKRSARGPAVERIMFLRNYAHQTICGELYQQERRTIEADPAAALHDMPLLRNIARRSKVSVGEGGCSVGAVVMQQVQDFVRNYKLLRDRINDLIDLKESGRPMPQGHEEVEAALTRLKAEKDKRNMAVILQRRDFDNCPVRPWVSVLGSDTKCPNTKLLYRECCGQKRSRVVHAM